jgi:hypothetical protein
MFVRSLARVARGWRRPTKLAGSPIRPARHFSSLDGCASGEDPTNSIFKSNKKWAQSKLSKVRQCRRGTV